LFNTYAAEAPGMTVKSRNLPVPAAASEQLQTSIASTGAAFFALGDQRLETSEDWEAFLAVRNSGQTIPLEPLAQMSDVTIEREQIAGINVYRVIPNEIAPEHTDHLFLHVHGGGYVLGGGDASVTEAVTIASASGIPAISIDYRMPPDYPFPTAVEDTVAVYKEVLKTHEANGIALGGTSAGGGLAFAAILQLKDQDIPLPGALYAGTPWADLSNTSDTLSTNAGVDRVLGSYEGFLEAAALLYANGRDLKDPLLSPLYGDFGGFPPTILFSGTRDLLLSDTVRSHRKLRAASVTADLHVFEGMSHAGYLVAGRAPEAQVMFAELSRFLKAHLH